MAKSDKFCPDFICEKCGGYMLYNFDLGSAECMKCHRTFPMFYSALEDAWLIEFSDGSEDDSFYMRDTNEMPECCIACGGPWPDCESSYKIFDD